MEVAPNPLMRTFTAPQPHSSHSRLHNSSSSSLSNPQHQSHTGSSFSTYSDPSASSASTRDTASSTLFPQPPSSTATPPPPPSGLQNVVPTDNVINKVADKGSSLFQICVHLRSRLQAIEGFEEFIEETHEVSLIQHEQRVAEERANHDAAAEAAGVSPEPFEAPEYIPLDPCDVLWHTFRRGYPLMLIYNTLQPDSPLAVDESRIHEEKRYKAAAFKFLQACVHKLKFATQDCFILSDLYGNDTSGFIKVANVVNRVLDLLVERGLIDPTDAINTSQADPSQKRTQRYFIVDELVRTERTYVHHLEVLQSFKKLVEQKGSIPGAAIHDIFLNLNALLDFQRRFLIRVEQVNSTPEHEQDWGLIFIANRTAFSVYEPYIANQKLCEETALREFDKLRDVGGSVELQQLVESPATLNAFLLKPFQRLSKYPLLLKDLREKGDFDEDRKESLSNAIALIQAVLERTNSFIASQERIAAVHELKARVDDWKGHRVESFGDLLLHGEFEVFKMDSSKQVRLYQMYLFQKILVCCKEIAEKQKGVKMSKNSSSIPSSNGRNKLALKGRIFMQNVVETTFLSKPGHYSCRISWRTEWMSDNIESFVVKFKTEEIMRLWRDTLERQRAESVKQAERGFNQVQAQTESVYMQQQGQLENPYKEEDTTEDDDPYNPGYGGNGETQDLLSRDSTASYRSRSTTGDSISPLQVAGRAGAGKYPPGFAAAPLTLRTNHLPASNSNSGSYFSPVAESPISSRTSSSSGVTYFPRQPVPQNNGWHTEESNRFTAPAHMARTVGKDQAAYNQADPRAARASQAPMPPSHPATLAQTRMRSASSPDVHSQNPARHVPMNAPPVPTVPSHLAHQQHTVNRSQSNSPIYPNGVPPRMSAQSPNNSARHRMREQSIDSRQSQEYRQSHEYVQGYGQDEHGYESRPDSFDRQWEGVGVASPPASTMSMLSDHQGPTNFKVKVEVPSEGSTMTLVVGYNISYQSLKDRIDAKLQRHTNLSLASGSVRLQYLYDDEMVSIQTDEDVQTAFETWKESQGGTILSNQYGEIRLFCNR